MAVGIFGVAAAYRPVIRKWVTRQDVPSVVSRGMYSPTVYGWAVLDGGITEIHRYGLTSLPSGIRVVGWQTLRLLVDELGLVPPRRPLPGEVLVDVEELRRRHNSGIAQDDEAHRCAELLASCEDGETTPGVARTLLIGPDPIESPLSDAEPQAGKGALAGRPVGPWLSERWVEQQLRERAVREGH